MKKSKSAMVTINITAHREGYLLYRTVKGALACRNHAEVNGISTTINIHLDNADNLTTDIANRFEKLGDAKVYVNSFGEPSSSRNFLVSKTDSEYTLMLDGDDFFSEDFITKSVAVAKKFKQPCIVSAEKIFKFNHSINPLVHVAESTVDIPEIKSALFETNLYVSQNLVSTRILKEHKYSQNTGNYAFEDWHWNTKVVTAGYEFLVAPHTAFFYRQKADDKSLLRFHTNSNMVIRDTPLFDPVYFKSLPYRSYYPPEEEAEVVDESHKLLRTGSKHLLGTDSISYRGVRKIYRAVRSVTAKTHQKKSSFTDYGSDNSSDVVKMNITGEEKTTWNRLNAIEPLIRFDSTNLDSFSEYRYTFEQSLVTTYHEFASKYGSEGFTDVLFVPWINKGGADLAMVDLAKELSKAGRRLLVITTMGLESEWSERISEIPGVVFIQSHDKIFRHLDHINIKIFFLRLVQNWSIQTMTVMNSAIGFELMERFGPAIRDTGCKVIVHNYAFPTYENLTVDAFPSMTTSLENIDCIVVDSIIHQEEFNQVYGIPNSRITEVPLTIDDRIAKKDNGTTRKILFANRIAREKRPDIALETLRILASDDISMDVYGTVDVTYADEIKFDENITSLDNVEFKGLFESSLALDFSQYDICFMPSLYEGTPRIVLEAASAGLYIVCTDAGGMPEVVQSNMSGEVLPVESTPQEFAQAIRRYYDSEGLQNVERRLKANKKHLSKHSFDFYSKQISDIYELEGVS